MTTPTDTAKLADEIEALAKDAGLDNLEVDPSAYIKASDISDLVCGEITVAEFLHRDNAALIVALVNNHATIIAALRELEAVKAENATLRELRRVSFINMLCILRQNGDRMEIYNEAATKIDPYSDEIIQTASIANDSVILERRAALGGEG